MSKFIVFEGGDGAGKTTQMDLLAQKLKDLGVAVEVTRQPGGTDLGGKIRQMLLEEKHDIDIRAELLLFAADKAQHVQEVIFPALKAGKVVLCDRYVDSALAYQGQDPEVDTIWLEQLLNWATFGLIPDLTVLLDADPKDTVKTMAEQDRIESRSLDFHEKVRQTFLQLARVSPQRYQVLSRQQSISSIAEQIFQQVQQLIALKK